MVAGVLVVVFGSGLGARNDRMCSYKRGLVGARE
jgi:hypothetical protein